jgi:hypothetical protein
MNAFNRLVLLIVALLLIAVPVVLLLAAFGVIPAEVLARYTGYDAALQSVGNLSEAVFTTVVRAIIAVVGALVALIALLLLLRELTFGRRVSRSAKMDDTPGRETVITAGAVRMLADSAAKEAGAVDPSTWLSTEKSGAYNVHSGIKVPKSGNYAEVATRARENVRRVLDDQGVPVGDVEITVQGSAS